MDSFISGLLIVALVFTMLDIVYSGRAAAGRSLVYTGVFIVLALVFHFGAGVFSEQPAE
jgi:drug/metabolite transporter superfamily protein YnfA